ncbi:hypothetical protein BJY00DRAFT_317625 [Aspergillus carlsbadensis]|nr:hypothetical protein BJY00DRAFT_317625 [Aspergillus carlsbadensis]
MPSKSRRNRGGERNGAPSLPYQRQRTSDPAHGAEEDSVQAVDAEAPQNSPAPPSTTSPGPDASDNMHNVQSTHPQTGPLTTDAGSDASESAPNTRLTDTSTASSTTSADPDTGESTRNATPAQSPDANASADTGDSASTVAATASRAAETPTHSNLGDANLRELIELLRIGAHCRLDNRRMEVLQGALYTLQVVPFLGDCAQIVYRSIRAAQKDLKYTRLESLELCRELVENKYEAWIYSGGPDKPAPRPGRIRQMYECVKWINEKSDQIKLTHELVFLCLKEYTRRNSTFHSELGNGGVEGNEQRIEDVFSRHIERVKRVVSTYQAGRLEEVAGMMDVARNLKAHFFRYQKEYDLGSSESAAPQGNSDLRSAASTPRRQELERPWRK